MEADWRLDERASAGAEHLDPAYVSSYERKSPADWSAEVAALLAAGVGSSSTVVDFGAGTGSFARALSPHVARVVSVDISEAMVGAMQAEGLEAVRAGFLTYEHQGGSPGAVYTRNALHHLPDFWKVIALDRIARMLPPGGVFRLRDLTYSFDPAETDDAVQRGLRMPPTTRSRGGPHASSRTTCVANTPPSRGSSNRCWNASASRSEIDGRVRIACTPHTPACVRDARMPVTGAG
jgi:SAM-dependent methyltransferase